MAGAGVKFAGTAPALDCCDGVDPLRGSCSGGGGRERLAVLVPALGWDEVGGTYADCVAGVVREGVLDEGVDVTRRPVLSRPSPGVDAAEDRGIWQPLASDTKNNVSIKLTEIDE